MGEQLGCKWHCYESQVSLTLTHPDSVQSFIKRRCCSKRPTKDGKENLNKKSDRPSTPDKTQSPPIAKNEQTVMVRDELMAFTAELRFGSQQVQNRIQ